MIRNEIRRFIKEEDGLNTVEIALILAVLVALALIFRDRITAFINSIIDAITGKGDSIIQ
jgi:Flp pilus assembly pilin Flp